MTIRCPRSSIPRRSRVEKVIAGKSQGIVHISPLKPGRYDFIGEYHDSTAKGQVIAE